MQRDDSVKTTKKEEAEPRTEESKPSVIKRWANLRNVVQVTGTHTEPSSPRKKPRNQRDSFIERFSVQRRLSHPSPTGQPENPLKSLDKTDGDDTVTVEVTETNSDAYPQKKQTVEESVSVAQNEKTEEPKVGVQTYDKTKSKGPTVKSSVSLDLLESQERMRSRGVCANPCWFQPHGRRLLAWLTLLSLSVLYNLWFIIARQAFTDFQARFIGCWIAVDLCADAIYALDIVVQMGTTYLEHGLVVLDRRKLAMKYVHTKYFVLDIISLLPLDFIQFEVGVQPILRFPRFIKIYRAMQWKDKIENRSTFPNLWRVVILIHILFLGCHWFACIYYIISAQQGFSTEWGYVMTNDSTVTTGRTYLITFYWATLALTTIGIEVPPTTVVE
ncbi:cyclic nucleotide gated channel alpha 2 [Paragonimus westermani]|uniref:Cyclic nucleotide gated channel alpha 2 n=1 Tax=Paragonimus westermani TaxID=34504 RepID=A0A5J4NS82_9TREM|nr:cyclic nucleotide gated channel alpha 2 [Paragonimus westermani]